MRARVVAYVLTLIAAMCSSSVSAGPESTESGQPMTVDELFESLPPRLSLESQLARSYYKFASEMKPVDWDNTPGPLNLEVAIWSYDINEHTTFRIEVTEYDGLTILGPLLTTVEIQPGDSDVVSIPVEIAPNDTGRVRVVVSTAWAGHNHAATLIADTVRVAYRDEWVYYEVYRDAWEGLPTMSEQADSINAERERIFKELEDGPRVVRTVMGKDGKWYNIDSLPPDFEVWSEPRDTVGRLRQRSDTDSCWSQNEDGAWVRADRDSLNRLARQRRIEKQWENIRKMEQQPCRLDAEVVEAGDETFIRHKGEVEFRPLAPRPRGWIPPADSAEYFSPPRSFHVVVDLSKRADSLAIIDIVDSLAPFDSAHLYHFEVDSKQMEKIEQSSVPYNFHPYLPVRESDSTDSLPSVEPRPGRLELRSRFQ